MIRAQVKAIYAGGVDALKDHVPHDPANFFLNVTVMVGPYGERGEESFDLYVCTPAWIAEKCERDGFVNGRHLLIVRDYDPDLIESLITKLVESCQGNSWEDVAEKVGRIGYWEFEDYRAAGP